MSAPDEILDAIRQIQEAFVRTPYDLPLEKWQAAFQADERGEAEIKIWHRAARVMKSLTQAREVSDEQRREMFRVLMNCMAATPQFVLQSTNPVTLSERRVKEIVSAFFSNDSAADDRRK